MFLYTVVEAIVAVVAGIFIARRAKRSDGVIYSRLDKAGRITNVFLALIYAVLSPLYLFLGMIAIPEYEGFLGFLGLIVAIIIASAALSCGIGLGLSVALRKKGRSKQSFVVQFVGILGIGVSVALFFIFYGNLLSTIN